MRRYLMMTPLLLAAALLPEVAEAKNVFDANHPDLKWYSIETDHFVVHFPKSRKKDGNKNYLTAEWTAKKTAKVAEEMWPRMTAEFNYPLKERIHIVILNQGDDLEGFTVPQWDWIEISANPGGDFYRIRGRMDWLPDVLVHEFAHVVSLKAQGTLSEGAQGVSIGGLYNNGLINTAAGGEGFYLDDDPFFWTEGGAEYYSDNSGYNWWTPSRDQHIRTTVLEDRLLTYEEWLTVQQAFRWGDGERGYQQGYAFALYLRQRFGNETYQKFALENAKGRKSSWLKNIETVTGVDGRTLYNDYVAYLREKYNQQHDAVRAGGEVSGRELGYTANDWEYTDPAGRDKFYDKRWKRKSKLQITGENIARIEREKAKEGTGRYRIPARISDDGKWIGTSDYGVITVSSGAEGSIDAFTGTAPSDAGVALSDKYRVVEAPGYFMDHWDFVPGQDALVLDNTRQAFPKPFEAVTGLSFNQDGYRNWKQLYYIPFGIEEQKEGNLRYQGVKWKKVITKTMLPEGAYAIPNTDRGSMPNVSPDGKRVAYFEYTDGTLNLVNIAIDGSDKRYLTHYDDGTWLQNVDWSPDGKKLILTMFRNFEQDIYELDAEDGKNIRALTWDRWEKADPFYGKDGLIYFSADPTAIFNIYAMDPVNKKVWQITNTIEGAHYPTMSPEGNLVFSSYTAYGWKHFGLPKEDFLWKDVTSTFNLDPDQAAVQASLTFHEDLSAYVPKPYVLAPMAPSFVPQLRIENESQDDIQVQGGGYVFGFDYAEFNTIYADVMLGSDWYARGQWIYSGWYPNIQAFVGHYEFKSVSGYLLDDDNQYDTKEDQTFWEIKQNARYNVANVSIDYPFNDRWRVFAGVFGINYDFMSTSDTDWQTYLLNGQAFGTLSFSNIGTYSTSANPRGGRSIDLNYIFGYTDIVYPGQDGVTVNDGQRLDNYAYNKGEIRYIEQIPVPSWGFLKEAARNRHTIQLDVDLGWVDRNVDSFDEFSAGGQHPYYFGSNSLRPNTLFSGYPANSLSGETMAMINLAYRFPIRREWNQRVGPLYIYDITGQVFGTAGNLWSYRAPTDPEKYYTDGYDQHVAINDSDVYREIPFVDYSEKNGNYMLFDAGAEVRVSSTLFSNVGWNSFFRVSYGFNRIRGLYDVNGDDIQDTTDNGIGNGQSNEVEEPGFRFYLGLGTGW